MAAFVTVLFWVIVGVVSLVAYVGIGAIIGGVCWSVWMKKQKNMLSFLLFPNSYVNGNLQDGRLMVPSGVTPFGLQKTNPEPRHKHEELRAEYVRFMVIIWPLKLTFNVMSWFWIAIACGTEFIIRKMEQMERRLFSSRIRVENPPPSRRARFEGLLVERQRIDTELNQLESELSEEEGAKVYRLPGRRSK